MLDVRTTALMPKTEVWLSLRWTKWPFSLKSKHSATVFSDAVAPEVKMTEYLDESVLKKARIL
jgi:hypothetical protein